MCADLGNLEDTVKRLDQPEINFFHFDIMDGTFVPNFTFGPDIVKALRPHTKKLFDVHLMIKNPERFIETFGEAGADMISVHVETTDHLQKTLQLIQHFGLKAGVALNPSTPIHYLDYVWDVVDYIVLMTVNPGFAGQKFIPLILEKIVILKETLNERKLKIPIQVDGNISFEMIPKVLQSGAEMLVCGTSSLFREGYSLEKSLNKLVQLIDQYKS